MFDNKVARIQDKFSFSTALDPESIPPSSANWKIVGKQSEFKVPVITESKINEYRKAKYAGGKGHYRNAYKLFSSRRTLSVKLIESSGATYVKASILKSYTGNVSMYLISVLDSYSNCILNICNRTTGVPGGNQTRSLPSSKLKQEADLSAVYTQTPLSQVYLIAITFDEYQYNRNTTIPMQQKTL